MFDTFSCFLNKFHCHIFAFVTHLPNSTSWQLSPRNSWSKPPYSVCRTAPSHSDSRTTLSLSLHNPYLIPSLDIATLISSHAKKNYIYKMFVSSIFRTFFVMFICCRAAQLLQSCCWRFFFSLSCNKAADSQRRASGWWSTITAITAVRKSINQKWIFCQSGFPFFFFALVKLEKWQFILPVVNQRYRCRI